MKPTEEQTGQPEQSLEEKVREILESASDISDLKTTSHSVEFLDHAIRYFVTASEISYFLEDAPGSRNKFTIREYQSKYGSIPEINAALPKIAALLTPEQPEQTLEEAVRELISNEGTFVGDELIIEPHEIKIVTNQYTVTITSEHVSDTLVEEKIRIDDLADSTWLESVQDLFSNIAAELKKRQSPTYDELEERVAELEEGKRLILKECEIWKRKHDELRGKYQRECSTSNELRARIRKLQDQLDSSVSEADHEAEIKDHQELLARVTLQRDDAREQAETYRQWFESEYAKNAGERA